MISMQSSSYSTITEVMLLILSRSYNKLFDEVLKIKRDIRELKEAKLPVRATMIPLKGGKYGK